MDDVEKSEYAKKGKEWVDEIGKTVGKTAEAVSKQGEQISQSNIYKSVSQVGSVLIGIGRRQVCLSHRSLF